MRPCSVGREKETEWPAEDRGDQLEVREGIEVGATFSGFLLRGKSGASRRGGSDSRGSEAAVRLSGVGWAAPGGGETSAGAAG